MVALAIGCLRGSFQNSRASHASSSMPRAYWPTFPRLSLANFRPAPLWQHPDSYVWAQILSSTWISFVPCATSTSSSSLPPFFLVLNHFHWFNFVQKLVFSDVDIIFVTSGSDFLFVEPAFELRISFDGAWDRLVRSLPPCHRLGSR